MVASKCIFLNKIYSCAYETMQIFWHGTNGNKKNWFNMKRLYITGTSMKICIAENIQTKKNKQAHTSVALSMTVTMWHSGPITVQFLTNSNNNQCQSLLCLTVCRYSNSSASHLCFPVFNEKSQNGVNKKSISFKDSCYYKMVALPGLLAGGWAWLSIRCCRTVLLAISCPSSLWLYKT